MENNVPQHRPDWCFFLDVDGTLLDFAQRPDAVLVDAGLRATLSGLRESCSGAVALVSGRSLEDIDRLFAPLQLPAAGQHGMEWRDALGRVHLRRVSGAALDRVRERLRRLAAESAALVLEDKGFNIAVHYRMAPHLGETVRVTVAELVAELGDQFETQEGKMVVEIKPRGHDKGTAIEQLMGEAPFRTRCPVFLGDDLTDEHGFAQVNRMGGHSIKVGPGASCARWRLADPAAARAWLAEHLERFAAG